MKTITLPPLTTDSVDVASSLAVWNYPAAENQLPQSSRSPAVSPNHDPRSSDRDCEAGQAAPRGPHPYLPSHRWSPRALLDCIGDGVEGLPRSADSSSIEDKESTRTKSTATAPTTTEDLLLQAASYGSASAMRITALLVTTSYLAALVLPAARLYRRIRASNTVTKSQSHTRRLASGWA